MFIITVIRKPFKQKKKKKKKKPKQLYSYLWMLLYFKHNWALSNIYIKGEYAHSYMYIFHF